MQSELVEVDRQLPIGKEIFLDHVGHFVPDPEAASRALVRAGFSPTPKSIQFSPDGSAISTGPTRSRVSPLRLRTRLKPRRDSHASPADPRTKQFAGSRSCLIADAWTSLPPMSSRP